MNKQELIHTESAQMHRKDQDCTKSSDVVVFRVEYGWLETGGRHGICSSICTWDVVGDPHQLGVLKCSKWDKRKPVAIFLNSVGLPGPNGQLDELYITADDVVMSHVFTPPVSRKGRGKGLRLIHGVPRRIEIKQHIFAPGEDDWSLPLSFHINTAELPARFQSTLKEGDWKL